MENGVPPDSVGHPLFILRKIGLLGLMFYPVVIRARRGLIRRRINWLPGTFSPPQPAEAVDRQQGRHGRQSGQAQDFADGLADRQVPELQRAIAATDNQGLPAR